MHVHTQDITVNLSIDVTVSFWQMFHMSLFFKFSISRFVSQGQFRFEANYQSISFIKIPSDHVGQINKESLEICILKICMTKMSTCQSCMYSNIDSIYSQYVCLCYRSSRCLHNNLEHHKSLFT